MKKDIDERKIDYNYDKAVKHDYNKKVEMSVLDYRIGPSIDKFDYYFKKFYDLDTYDYYNKKEEIKENREKKREKYAWKIDI